MQTGTSHQRGKKTTPEVNQVTSTVAAEGSNKGDVQRTRGPTHRECMCVSKGGRIPGGRIGDGAVGSMRRGSTELDALSSVLFGTGVFFTGAQAA